VPELVYDAVDGGRPNPGITDYLPGRTRGIHPGGEYDFGVVSKNNSRRNWMFIGNITLDKRVGHNERFVEKVVIPEIRRNYPHPDGFSKNYTHMAVFPLRKRSEDESLSYLYTNYPHLSDDEEIAHGYGNMDNLTSSNAGDALNLHLKAMNERNLWNNQSYDIMVNMSMYHRGLLVDAMYAKQVGFAIPLVDVERYGSYLNDLSDEPGS